eukprot:754287-Hanusia_phi.AAC.4
MSSETRRDVMRKALTFGALAPIKVFAEGAVNLNPLADEWEGFKETRSFKRAGKEIVLEQVLRSYAGWRGSKYVHITGVLVQEEEWACVTLEGFLEGQERLGAWMRCCCTPTSSSRFSLACLVGTGLGSITASLLGAKLVTASDRDPVVSARRVMAQ